LVRDGSIGLNSGEQRREHRIHRVGAGVSIAELPALEQLTSRLIGAQHPLQVMLQHPVASLQATMPRGSDGNHGVRLSAWLRPGTDLRRMAGRAAPPAATLQPPEDQLDGDSRRVATTTPKITSAAITPPSAQPARVPAGRSDTAATATRRRSCPTAEDRQSPLVNAVHRILEHNTIQRVSMGLRCCDIAPGEVWRRSRLRPDPPP
jgi:hypothetical protein